MSVGPSPATPSTCSTGQSTGTCRTQPPRRDMWRRLGRMRCRERRRGPQTSASAMCRNMCRKRDAMTEKRLRGRLFSQDTTSVFRQKIAQIFGSRHGSWDLDQISSTMRVDAVISTPSISVDVQGSIGHGCYSLHVGGHRSPPCCAKNFCRKR